MKALRYLGPKQALALQEVPVPEPKAGEVRVKVAASGLCHTELHFQSGLLDIGVHGVTMGHEAVGHIDAVGPGVDGARIGERVIVYYYFGCGVCEACRRGDEQICAAPRAQFGFVSDGGDAEYLTCPARNAVVLPAGISDVEAAPIGCAVTTAVHASKLAEAQPEEWVVVYGIGGVGLALVQLAKSRGQRVIAVGRDPRKLALAKELGAEYTLSPIGIDVATTIGSRVDSIAPVPDLPTRIKALTGGGADVIYECVGSRETMDTALASLGKRGRLVMIGYSEASLTVHPIQLIVHEQKVLGSVGATLQDLHEAIDLVARGVVRNPIARTVKLEAHEEALAALAAGDVVGKIVFVP